MATGDPPQICGKLELGATFGHFVSLILGDFWTINLQFGAVIYIFTLRAESPVVVAVKSRVAYLGNTPLLARVRPITGGGTKPIFIMVSNILGISYLCKIGTSTFKGVSSLLVQ